MHRTLRLTAVSPAAVPFGLPLDALFGPALGAGRAAPERQPARSIAAPAAMDVTRDAEQVVVRVDLPGYNAEQIDARIDDGVLNITAQREHVDEPDAVTVRRERTCERVHRAVRLSDAIDTDGVQAHLADGVLTVRLPIAEAPEPAPIAITTGASTA